jgi:hypothetical protein
MFFFKMDSVTKTRMKKYDVTELMFFLSDDLFYFRFAASFLYQIIFGEYGMWL